MGGNKKKKKGGSEEETHGRGYDERGGRDEESMQGKEVRRETGK